MHIDEDDRGAVVVIIICAVAAVLILAIGLSGAHEYVYPKYECPHCGNTYYQSELVKDVGGSGGLRNHATYNYICPNCNANAERVVIDLDLCEVN